MFFISDVSLIYINVNSCQGDVIVKTIIGSKLFNLYAVFRENIRKMDMNNRGYNDLLSTYQKTKIC